jgi:hypothetical protein
MKYPPAKKPLARHLQKAGGERLEQGQLPPWEDRACKHAVCVNPIETGGISGRFLFRMEKAAEFEAVTEGQAGANQKGRGFLMFYAY